MTTIVNSPAPTGENGTGFLIGVVVLVSFGFLFIYYGLPAIKNMNPVKIEVATPAIEIPNSVDVNVKPAQ